MEEGGFEMINTDRLKLSIHWNDEVPCFFVRWQERGHCRAVVVTVKLHYV